MEPDEYSDCCFENLHGFGFGGDGKGNIVNFYKCLKCGKKYVLEISGEESTELGDFLYGTFPGEKVKELIKEGKFYRKYNNKYCKSDCIGTLEVLAKTQCNPGMACGEGEWDVLFKCRECETLYTATQFSDFNGISSSDQQKFDLKLDEGTLIEEIGEMFGHINWQRLKDLERK